MKAIDPNYEPPEREFNPYPDGKYKIKNFVWTSLDEKERPILVAQKDGKLVGRLRFNLVSGEEGPPMSLTLPEMNLMAKGFGVKNLPSVPDEAYAGLVTKYMVDIKNLCAEKELEVEVQKGWVNSLPGMVVPEGYYHFYLVDISSPERDKDGNPAPKAGQKYGSFFFVTFQVEKSEEEDYRGAQFTELVNYALKVENGELDFERNKEGAYTASAVRLSKLMRLTAPDPFGGDFTFPNIHNILPFFKQKALENKVLLKGARAKEEKGSRIRLVWSTLTESNYQPEPKRIVETMDIDTKIKDVLVEALEKLAGGEKVLNQGTYEFTLAGSKVAKEYLSPLKKEGLITHGSLPELNYEEIVTILTSLSDKIGSDYKNRVVALGVGFELEEEEDTPF